MLVCLEEVRLFGFDRPCVKLDLVLLPGTGLGVFTERAQQQACTLLRHSLRGRVLVLLEILQQVPVRALQQHEEEKVLGEADSAIAVCVDLLKDVGLVLLQILVGLLEVRSVAVGSHRMQEVLVRHSQFAILRLLTGKDFERLLGWRKEPNLVLVVAADLLGSPRIVTLTRLVFLSLFGKV